MSRGKQTEITFSRLCVFSAAAIPTAMMLSPVGVILPAFYAKYTTATLASIGAALMFGRLLDAFLDPVVGYLSDITPGKFGRRKPWMLAGSIVAMISVLFLFNPPLDAGGTWYFLTLLGMFTAFTMLDIPHRSWGSELSSDYDTRTRISTYLGFAGTLGFVLLLGLPQLPMFDSSDITPKTLHIMGWIIIGAMPLAWVTIFRARENRLVANASPNLLALVKSIGGSKPFWNYFAAFVTAGLGNGIHLVLVYMFLDQYLGIGEVVLVSTLTYVLTQLAGLPLWLKISSYVGKHRAWAIGQALYAIFHFAVLWLPRGPESFYPFLVLTALSGLSTSVLMFAPMAVLGDVVDYDTMKTRVNRSGSFFALQTLVMKANFAVGGALGLFAVALLGFDPKGGNSEEVMDSFVFFFVLAPQVLSLISCAIIAKFPLDRRRQSIVARKLERISARDVRQLPGT